MSAIRYLSLLPSPCIQRVQVGVADSPWGALWSVRSELGLHSLQPEAPDIPECIAASHDDHGYCQSLINGMASKSDRHRLPELILCPQGSTFQHAVWQALLKIPYGQTQSYQQVAQAIGRPTAHRAIANAIGKNPIAILIPCHRVIRSDRTLGGYRWGVSLKQQLLHHEGELLLDW